MIDWTASGMEQTYEYYIVDPTTWKDKEQINIVTKSKVKRDKTESTLGSAMFSCTESLGECYIRTYLVATLGDITEKVCLGTHLVQTPSKSFDGKNESVELDAYTPLIVLKNIPPKIGYSLLKETLIMETAARLCRENLQAPVVPAASTQKLTSNFVSNLDDTWLTFIGDLIATADHEFGLDDFSRVIFEPIQDIASLRPVWTYNDDNSSILEPDITDERDLYGVPNVVEVIYSKDVGYMYSRIVNDDPNSPISTVNRGREVVHRESNPKLSGEPTQEYLDAYATQLLRNLSCLEHTITYTHGYCPVRIGDCVLLNYERAGLFNVKARVMYQTINCETGCRVEETAVYTTKLWR